MSSQTKTQEKLIASIRKTKNQPQHENADTRGQSVKKARPSSPENKVSTSKKVVVKKASAKKVVKKEVPKTTVNLYQSSRVWPD